MNKIIRMFSSVITAFLVCSCAQKSIISQGIPEAARRDLAAKNLPPCQTPFDLKQNKSPAPWFSNDVHCQTSKKSVLKLEENMYDSDRTYVWRVTLEDGRYFLFVQSWKLARTLQDAQIFCIDNQRTFSERFRVPDEDDLDFLLVQGWKEISTDDFWIQQDELTSHGPKKALCIGPLH